MRSAITSWKVGTLWAVSLLLCSACSEGEPNGTVADADVHNRVYFHKDVAYTCVQLPHGGCEYQFVNERAQDYTGQLSDPDDVDIWSIKPLSDGNSITFSAFVWPGTISSGECMRFSLSKCTKPGVERFATCPQENRQNHFVQWQVCQYTGVNTYPAPLSVPKDELMLVSVLKTKSSSQIPYWFWLSSP